MGQKLESALMHETPYDSAPVVIVAGLMGGAAAMIGVQTAVKEAVFPSNDQYEDEMHVIHKAKDAQNELESAAKALDGSGLHDQASENRQTAQQYNTTIAEAKDKLPHDYNPHIEGGVSNTAGILTAAAIVYASMRYARNHRKNKQ